MNKTCLRLSAAVMVLICLAAALAVPASAKNDLPSVISEAQKGVVKLYVTAFDQNQEPYAAVVGSGFAVGEKGDVPEYFITNWHVAHAFLQEEDTYFDSEHVRIWIMLDDFAISDVTGLPSEATSVECNIVRSSESGYPDYAILKAVRPVKECTPLPIRSSEEVKQGETAVALGCPAVVDNQSVNVGSNDITATTGSIARHMVMASAGNTSVLLHTAVISGGNSGGPLIDEGGNVIGLNTYGIVDSYACAIYSDYITTILDELSIPYMTPDAGFQDIPIAVVGVIAAAVLAAVLFLRMRKPAPSGNRDAVAVGSKGNSGTSAPAATEPAAFTGTSTFFSLEMPDGRVIPLRDGKVTVGRDPSCQVTFPENAATVSRRHCTLENGGEFLILLDEGSRNGTFIHGKKVPNGSKVALKRGSSFCVGSTENRITVR